MNTLSTTFETKGNAELLSQQKIALFASKTAPKKIYPFALEIFKQLSARQICISGGWQAPLEKYLFAKAHKHDRANYLYYMATDINKTAISAEIQTLLEEQKLLIISPGISQTRTSGRLVAKRDALIFSQIKKIIFLYIERGGRLEYYYNQLISEGYDVYVLDHPLNRDFLIDTVVRLNEDNLISFF